MAGKDKKRGSVPTVTRRRPVIQYQSFPGTGETRRSDVPEIDPMRNIVPGGAGPSREILEDLEREQAAKEAAQFADPGPLTRRKPSVTYTSVDTPEVSKEDVPQVEEDPQMVEELGSIIDPSIAITRDAEPEFETTGEEPETTRDKHWEVVIGGTAIVKADDFKETGEYIVTLTDDSTRRIFRDTEQFSSPTWHIVGDQENPAGIGSTINEAVEYLERQVTGELETFETTVEPSPTEDWEQRSKEVKRPWVHPEVLAGTWIEPDLSKRTPEDWRRSGEQIEEMVQDFGERGKEDKERMIAELAEEERAAAAEKAAALADPGPVTYESKIPQRSDSDIENIRGHALADFKVTGGSPDSEVNQMISLMPRRSHYFKTIPFSGSIHGRTPDQNSFWYRGFPVHRLTTGSAGLDKYYTIFAPDNETLIFQGYTTEYTEPGTEYVPNHELMYSMSRAEPVTSRKVIKRIIDEYWTNYDKNTPDGALLTDPEKSVGKNYTKGQFKADMEALRLDEFLEAPHIGSVQQFHAGGFVEASTLSTVSPFIV